MNEDCLVKDLSFRVHRVSVIRSDGAGGSRHVLDGHLGTAVNIFRHVMGQKMRPPVVETASG